MYQIQDYGGWYVTGTSLYSSAQIGATNPYVQEGTLGAIEGLSNTGTLIGTSVGAVSGAGGQLFGSGDFGKLRNRFRYRKQVPILKENGYVDYLSDSIIDRQFYPTNKTRRNFGTYVHQQLPIEIPKHFPGTTFKFNVGPGEQGPDIEFKGGTNLSFDFADLKPRTMSGYKSFQIQLDNWPETNAGLIFYDPATGVIDFDNIYIYEPF